MPQRRSAAPESDPPADLPADADAAAQAPLAKEDFEALSDFRYQLRRFLRFSEDAARREGLTVQQYLLLLHIRGCPGKSWASVGELAERLQAQQHGVVALVNRCEAAGLVRRRANDADRRIVEVHLLPKGERCLSRLAMLHRTELESLRGIFRVARITAFNDDGADRG
jgi:DNA-binding MarR family transcriptional regulator